MSRKTENTAEIALRNEPPPRVAARPDPSQWAPDELMTLPEAAALFWPFGPLTVASLRTAIRRRQLAHVDVARKLLTTKAAIGAMSVCRAGPPADRGAEPRAVPNPAVIHGARERIAQMRRLAR